MSPGRGFYPQGLARDKVETFVKEHPEKKAELYSPTTVVRWHGDQLEALPYHIAYRSFLEPAAKALRDAAALSADPAFANFLRLRADALLTDDYYASDIAWLDLKNPKFDIIFAPYETYLDDLLGVKTSYGAAILIRNDAESQKLAMYQQWVPDIQDALPLAADRSAVGARPRHADGSHGRAVPRRRPAPRLPGGRRQPAERSAHPPGEGHQEDLLQEFHGRARERRSSCRSPRGDGPAQASARRRRAISLAR